MSSNEDAISRLKRMQEDINTKFENQEISTSE